MEKYIAMASIVIILALVSFHYLNEDVSSVCFDNRCFKVEVAKTPAERASGFMFRDNIENNTGMLFVFDSQGEYYFWMKDTPTSLDIIWLDEQKKVVYVKENAQPCFYDSCEKFTSGQPGLYVLEIPAGQAKEYNISVGKIANFK